MSDSFDAIDAPMRAWIGRQALFFVGTAPLSKKGHVNVSPKGPIGSLRVMDEKTIAYLDTIGSGAETIAHIRENARVCVMLCAFEGKPRIVRLHGRGEIVTPQSKRFAELVAACDFDDPGVEEARRAVIVVHLDRVADSCGYGVPLMKYEGARTHMAAWGRAKVRKGGTLALDEYRERKNAKSIDGLPALDVPAKKKRSATQP